MLGNMKFLKSFPKKGAEPSFGLSPLQSSNFNEKKIYSNKKITVFKHYRTHFP